MNASAETWHLGNQTVQVTHLEKVYWPQTGFTKGEVLDYYRQIAPVLLPYLKERPVTLRMYPQGVEETSFYLRDCPADAPKWLRRVMYQPKTVNHSVPLPLVDTAAGLLWFANQGAIEVHLWGSRTPDLTQPDLAIFDLDAGSTASFDVIREAALRLHDALERAGVRGYPKTSGRWTAHLCATRTRFHLRVRPPMGQSGGERADVEVSRSHCTSPRRDTPGRSCDGRLCAEQPRTQHGSPYTLRAHPNHPTVSTPLTWEELDAGTIHPATLTPQVVLERVSRMGDLFTPALQADQRIDEL